MPNLQQRQRKTRHSDPETVLKERRHLLKATTMILVAPALTTAPAVVRSIASAVNHNTVNRYQGLAFGSSWSLTLPAVDNPTDAFREIESVVAQTNALFSPYASDSSLSGFNHFKHTGSYTFPESAAPVLTVAFDQAHNSRGIFDPTLGPSVSPVGFGP